jgi:hypothetical protein
MEKNRRLIPWLSGILATLVALLIVAVTLPNTDRAVVDHSFNPPHIYVKPQPWVVCYVLVLSFIPVICIFVLSRRWRFFEWLGWAFLGFLLLSMVSS